MEGVDVAAKRGHAVTLAEAMPDLGGTLELASRAPTRQQFKDFILWLQNEIYTEGAQMSHPGEPIEGIHPGHVVSSNELFHDMNAAKATHALVIDDVGHYEGLGWHGFRYTSALAR